MKHFRTDLHQYIDKLLFHPIHHKKAQKKKAPATATGETHSAFTHKDFVKDACTSNTFLQDDGLEAMSAKVKPNETSFESYLLTCGLKDAFRKEFPIKTEVMALIPKCGKMKVVMESGATFSGIDIRKVEEAGLAKKVRPTKMTYRTSSGEIRPAEGKVMVKVEIGHLIVKAPMAVMPRECSYNALIANDIMGPLDVDILRSSDSVVFHFQGMEISVPMLLREGEEKEQIPESYFITTVQDYADPWLDEVPTYKIRQSKNVLRI
jgi:hypothetical protein